MKAILLAAGRGRRLNPHTADRPTCLVEVGGVPLIDWQLAALRAAGIDEVVLVRGYGRGRLSGEGLRVVDNPQWSSTATGESLRQAAHELHGDVVVARTDLLYHPSVVQAARESRAPMALVVDSATPSPRIDAPGEGDERRRLLRLDERGMVAEIGADSESASGALVRSIGMLRLSPAGSDRLRRRLAHRAREEGGAGEATERGTLGRASLHDLLSEGVEAGMGLHCVPARGDWVGIDRPADLRRAEEEIRGESWALLRRELDGLRLRRPA